VTKRFQPTPPPKPQDDIRDTRTHLVRPEASGLKLADDAAAEKIGDGYNPYDTLPNLRQPGHAQRQADLRKLSEWIRAKRQADKVRKENAPPPDPASLEDTLPGDQPFWPERR
jgi:hypothetical protein